MKRDNYKIFKQLRNKYSSFIFDDFSVSSDNDTVKVRFDFWVDDLFHFSPTLTIPENRFISNELSNSDLDTLAFHLGMIELISYWKAACPAKIIVRPFKLSGKQINWWKKLYFNGLGEFFYTNGIETTQDDFVEIISESKKDFLPVEVPLNDKVLVPVGGGKDSVVTLELLKKEFDIIPLILNPRKATTDTIEVAGFGRDGFFRIQRTIDPLLLKLNERGFLNGHTPFSAMLAFVTLFASAMTGARHIALSNESSANEPTESDSGVNHQYSKSYEFEADFREYVKQYISGDINYFSFLRPLSELQIAGLFSQFENYHPVFRSCNAGSKTDSWCGKCPKCLFTAIILSPFLNRQKIVNIFNADILNDGTLQPVFDELTGVTPVKPFECVGTVDEVNAAIIRVINISDDLPSLIAKYKAGDLYKYYGNTDFDGLLTDFNKEHFLNEVFEKILLENLELKPLK